jgi:hypothetical protein
VGGVEYGDAGSKSPFPREWGRPVGDVYSEERARWVRESLRGASMRQLWLRQMQIVLHLRQRLYESQALYEEEQRNV